MNETGFVTNVSRGTTACMIGIALGFGIPWAIPGVVLMCVILAAMDA